MSTRVSVVDYGSGNICSVTRALEHCGAQVQVVTEAEQVLAAERVLLPGVGAFAHAMTALRDRQLVEPLVEVARRGTPLLGVCVGMQLLLDGSEEFGWHAGLGLVPGTVRAIPEAGADGRRHRIPNVGWRGLWPVPATNAWSRTLFADIEPGESAYFVHSFTAWPSAESSRLADSDYDGCRVCAAVQHEAVVGCQFHPEKSGPVGLRLLHRFVHGN